MSVLLTALDRMNPFSVLVAARHGDLGADWRESGRHNNNWIHSYFFRRKDATDYNYTGSRAWHEKLHECPRLPKEVIK